MTDLRITFSSSRFPRFIASFQKLLASPKVSSSPSFRHYLMHTVFFSHYDNSVLFRLNSDERVTLSSNYIYVKLLDFDPFTLPRYNGRAISVYSYS